MDYELKWRRQERVVRLRWHCRVVRVDHRKQKRADRIEALVRAQERADVRRAFGLVGLQLRQLVPPLTAIHDAMRKAEAEFEAMFALRLVDGGLLFEKDGQGFLRPQRVNPVNDYRVRNI